MCYQSYSNLAMAEQKYTEDRLVDTESVRYQNMLENYREDWADLNCDCSYNKLSDEEKEQADAWAEEKICNTWNDK